MICLLNCNLNPLDKKEAWTNSLEKHNIPQLPLMKMLYFSNYLVMMVNQDSIDLTEEALNQFLSMIL